MSGVAVASPSIGLWVPGEGTPFSDVLPKYLIAHPALKPNSAGQMKTVCNLVTEWLSPQCTCDEIFTLDAFEAWVKWLFDSPIRRGARPGQKRSPHTIVNKRDYLWSLWAFAFRRGLCDEAPPPRDELATISCPKEDPVAWSPEQISRIINYCRLARSVEWWQPAHWLSLIWTNWYSAERIGALLSCRRSDLVDGVLYVRGCRSKDKKPGVHRLKRELVDLINTLPTLSGSRVPADKQDLIWPCPLKIGALRARYRKDILEPAGMPTDRYHLFHCIRRSTITELVNAAGVNAAQELARHSSPALTMDSYVSKRLLRTKAAADVLPDPTRPAEQQMTLSFR